MHEKLRCSWSYTGNNPLYIEYHDREWGVPLHDDNHLFEMLVLEGAQAGLSWLTVLKKRDSFRKAFANFDPEAVSLFGESHINELMNNPEIIRNERKIKSAITNAVKFIEVQDEFGTFDNYVWDFVHDEPIVNHWKSVKEIPSRTELSDVLSRDLLKRGFSFVGSTICYAYMQSTGLVNDHVEECFRFQELMDLK